MFDVCPLYNITAANVCIIHSLIFSEKCEPLKSWQAGNDLDTIGHVMYIISSLTYTAMLFEGGPLLPADNNGSLRHDGG